MSLTNAQLPQRFQDVIDAQVELYDSDRTIELADEIPGTNDIPVKDPTRWLHIEGVVCVFADMMGSTRLTAEEDDLSAVAGAYQLYTGTLVRVFHAFEAPYIDVQGDAVFALFDEVQAYRALAAAVTAKTFANEIAIPRIREDTDVPVGSKMGIDVDSVLVRRIGLEKRKGRNDRQNEVWAGAPVSMAAKLASLAADNQLVVSDAYYELIPADPAQYSCGCSGGKPDQGVVPLWSELDVSDNPDFDFNTAHALGSVWCERHGDEYCEAILAEDEE